MNRELALPHSGALRESAPVCARAAYSTLMTLLSRGVGGAAFDTVMRICAALEIDPRDV